MRQRIQRWGRRNPINKVILRESLDGKQYKRSLPNLSPKGKDLLVEIVDMRTTKNYHAPWVLRDLVFRELFNFEDLDLDEISEDTAHLLEEDSPKIKSWLADYEELSRRNKAIRSRYPLSKKGIKNADELFMLLKRLMPDKYDLQTIETDLPGTTEYPEFDLSDATFRVLKIEGKAGLETLMDLAQGTEWCTAGEEAAKHYLSENAVIVILKNNKPDVQAHIGLKHSIQIMNIYDDPIDLSLPGEERILPGAADSTAVGTIKYILDSIRYFERAFTFYEKKLTSNSYAVISSALDGMGALGSREYGGNVEAIKQVAKFLYDKRGAGRIENVFSTEESLRSNAAKSLGYSGSPLAAPYLIDCFLSTSLDSTSKLAPTPRGLRVPDAEFRSDLLLALKKCGGPDVIPFLIKVALEEFTPRTPIRILTAILQEKALALRALSYLSLVSRNIIRSLSEEERLDLQYQVLPAFQRIAEDYDLLNSGKQGRDVLFTAISYLLKSKLKAAYLPMIDMLNAYNYSLPEMRPVLRHIQKRLRNSVSERYDIETALVYKLESIIKNNPSYNVTTLVVASSLVFILGPILRRVGNHTPMLVPLVTTVLEDLLRASTFRVNENFDSEFNGNYVVFNDAVTAGLGVYQNSRVPLLYVMKDPSPYNYRILDMRSTSLAQLAETAVNAYIDRRNKPDSLFDGGSKILSEFPIIVNRQLRSCRRRADDAIEGISSNYEAVDEPALSVNDVISTVEPIYRAVKIIDNASSKALLNIFVMLVRAHRSGISDKVHGMHLREMYLRTLRDLYRTTGKALPSIIRETIDNTESGELRGKLLKIINARYPALRGILSEIDPKEWPRHVKNLIITCPDCAEPSMDCSCPR